MESETKWAIAIAAGLAVDLIAGAIAAGFTAFVNEIADPAVPFSVTITTIAGLALGLFPGIPVAQRVYRSL